MPYSVPWLQYHLYAKAPGPFFLAWPSPNKATNPTRLKQSFRFLPSLPSQPPSTAVYSIRILPAALMEAPSGESPFLPLHEQSFIEQGWFSLHPPHRRHSSNLMSELVSRSVHPSSQYRYIFFLFMTAPATYGSSWARCRIGAAAAGLHHSHSNARFESHL